MKSLNPSRIILTKFHISNALTLLIKFRNNTEIDSSSDNLLIYIMNKMNENFTLYKKSNHFKFLRHVWPWAKMDAIQHDSYHCQKYLNSEPFPTQRNIGPNNFIGSANKSNSQWNNKYPCPIPCRPTKHQDWIYC